VAVTQADTPVRGYGNDSCEIGPLAGSGFLGSHSNARKQLSYHGHRGLIWARRFRGNHEMIAYFRHQVSNNHHLMARSYGRGEGSSAYGPKMHESLPYPDMRHRRAISWWGTA
jgi:hypothetical protein